MSKLNKTRLDDRLDKADDEAPHVRSMLETLYAEVRRRWSEYEHEAKAERVLDAECITQGRIVDELRAADRAKKLVKQRTELARDGDGAPQVTVVTERDGARRDAEEKKLTRLKNKHKKAKAAKRRAHTAFLDTSALYSACARVIEQWPADKPFRAAKLPKPKDSDMLDDVREQHAAQTHDREHTERAVALSPEDAYARVDAAVEHMIERGRPSVVKHLLRPSDFPLEIRIPVGRSDLGDRLYRHADFAAWLHPEAMKARLKAEIDAQASVTEGMSAADRAAKLAELDAEIYRLELLEEALVRVTEGAVRRAKANPYIVLQLQPN